MTDNDSECLTFMNIDLDERERFVSSHSIFPDSYSNSLDNSNFDCQNSNFIVDDNAENFSVDDDGEYFTQEPKLDFLNFDNEAETNQNIREVVEDSASQSENEEIILQAVATVPSAEIVTATISEPMTNKLAKKIIFPLPAPESSNFDYEEFEKLNAKKLIKENSTEIIPIQSNARPDDFDDADNASIASIRSSQSSPSPSVCLPAESNLVFSSAEISKPKKCGGRKRKNKNSEEKKIFEEENSPQENNKNTNKSQNQNEIDENDNFNSNDINNNNNGSDFDILDSSIPLSDPVLESKRLHRLQRNRASAQLSRERKKAYMSELENQLKELTTVNNKLEEQKIQLEKENEKLKQKLEFNPITSNPNNPPNETRALEVFVAHPSHQTNKRPKLSTSKRIFASNSATASVFNSATSARTTMALMVSIILTMAFVCSMVNIDNIDGTNSGANNNNNNNKNLNPVETRKFSSSPLFPSVPLLSSRSSRVLSSISDSSDVGDKKEKFALVDSPQSPTIKTFDRDEDSRALVMKVKQENFQQEENDKQKNNKCRSSEEENSDISSEHRHYSKLFHPDREYRIENFSSGAHTQNSTARPILLCPQSFIINPTINGGKHGKSGGQKQNENYSDDEENNRRAKRIKRLRLPAPAATTTTPATSSALSVNSSPPRLSLAPNDELNFWLPSSTVDFETAGLNSSINSPMVQVTCKISAIQQVEHADEQ